MKIQCLILQRGVRIPLGEGSRLPKSTHSTLVSSLKLLCGGVGGGHSRESGRTQQPGLGGRGEGGVTQWHQHLAWDPGLVPEQSAPPSTTRRLPPA